MAPNANAISLTRSTGIVIDAAASGSSRTARQARPVREVWSSRSTAIVADEQDDEQVVVALVAFQLDTEAVDGVDPDDSVRPAEHAR